LLFKDRELRSNIQGFLCTNIRRAIIFAADVYESYGIMKIAICGIRGIPACYGGFETFAEELSSRLVAKGHQVRVYGRKHVINYANDTYKGVEIKLLAAPRHKYFETPVHTINCIIHLLFNRVDAVLVCNAANSPFLWLLRLRGIPVAVNVDGIERKRAKWNSIGRLWYRIGEISSVIFANRVIADAKVIGDYYQAKYKASSEIIPYGFIDMGDERLLSKLQASLTPTEGELSRLRELNLEPGKFLLYVSRLEPENNAHVVIDAYNRLSSEFKSYPLVIVGDAPYAKEYKDGLLAKASPSIRFLGFRFGDDYKLLQLHCYLYIQATEVGGTHPALVEAMGFANCVVANSTPENEEVLGDSGLYYLRNDSLSLFEKFERLLKDNSLCLSLRKSARKRAQTDYSWDKITNTYERLLASLAK